MTNPTYTLECAFGTANPLTDPGAWTDITAYLRGFDVARGRQHELSRTQAGVADIRLRNTDRRFDPVNTSGPYTPNVLPMRQIRLRATFSAVTYDLFRGFVEDWAQDWAGRPLNATGDAEAQVHAVDAFKVLSLAQLRSYSTEVLADNPLIYWPLTGSSQQGVDLGSFGSNPTTAGASGSFGRVDSPFATKAGETSLDSPGGAGVFAISDPSINSATFPADPITLEGWLNLDAAPGGINAHLIQLSDLVHVTVLDIDTTGHVQFIYLDTGSNSVTVTGAGTPFATNGVWHHVAATRDGGIIKLYLDGALTDTFTGRGLPLSPFNVGTTMTTGNQLNGAIAHLAVYQEALSAQRIAAHYAANTNTITNVSSDTAIGYLLNAVGWPSALRNLDTGLSTVTVMPSGFALDVIQAIGEDTEHGLVFVDGTGKVTFTGRDTLEAKNSSLASFGDSGSDVGYADLHLTYDDHDLWTEIVATGADGVEQIADDATAQASYGVRVLTDTGLEATANEVYDHAQGLLQTYKAPAFRPQTMNLGGTSTTAGATSSLKEQLARLLGDYVTVKRTPPGGGPAISRTALIEGVKHSSSGRAGSKLTTEVSLVPAFPNIPWLLGDSTYGVLGTTTDLGW